MNNPRTLLLLACAVSLPVTGCGDEEPETRAATDPCPHISMDRMVGRWIKVNGETGDHTHRFEMTETSTGPELWYTGGGFTKRRLAGEKRASDYMFTEMPDERKKLAYEKGEEGLVRLYVEPWKQKCSLRVTEVQVFLKEGSQSERPKPGFSEYLPFPENNEFSFRPCDGPVFLGAAATDHKAAEKQLSSLGGPDPAHSLGEAIPVGAWTRVEADGDPACSYDMDLYFDDRPAKDKDSNVQKAIAAGPVQGEFRQWLVPAWYAPYSGNHHFELHRYRSCPGQERTLIGVSCLEAVLQ